MDRIGIAAMGNGDGAGAGESSDEVEGRLNRGGCALGRAWRRLATSSRLVARATPVAGIGIARAQFNAAADPDGAISRLADLT